MSCGLGLSFFPTQYKSPTGLERAGCPIRLKELNNASKVSPTKLKGAQVARENYIRRRVATIKQVKSCLPEDKKFKGENCNTTYAYGPVFGIARGPKYGGRNPAKGCKGGGCVNVYYANGGTGADVVQWKRLYGGPRVLFNTSNCSYGCCGKVGTEGLSNGCYCYTMILPLPKGTLRRGDVLWPGRAYSNTPPIDMFDAVVIDVLDFEGGAAPGGVSLDSEYIRVRTKNKYSYMSQVLSTRHPSNLEQLFLGKESNTTPPLAVYRKDRLNNWHLVKTIKFWVAGSNEQVIFNAVANAMVQNAPEFSGQPGLWMGQPCTTKKLIQPV